MESRYANRYGMSDLAQLASYRFKGLEAPSQIHYKDSSRRIQAERQQQVAAPTGIPLSREHHGLFDVPLRTTKGALQFWRRLWIALVLGLYSCGSLYP